MDKDSRDMVLSIFFWVEYAIGLVLSITALIKSSVVFAIAGAGFLIFSGLGLIGIIIIWNLGE